MHARRRPDRRHRQRQERRRRRVRAARRHGRRYRRDRARADRGRRRRDAARSQTHFGAAFVRAGRRHGPRPACATRVFADPAAKQALEALLHPMIRAEVAAPHRARRRGPYVVHRRAAAGRVAATTATRVDRVLVVDCPEEVQVARVMQRSGLAADAGARHHGAQVTRARAPAPRADDVIDNGGDAGGAARQAGRAARELRSRMPAAMAVKRHSSRCR